MARPDDAGRRLEVHFTDADLAVQVDVDDGNPDEALADLADHLVTAVEMDGADDAERHLEVNVRDAGRVTRLP